MCELVTVNCAHINRIVYTHKLFFFKKCTIMPLKLHILLIEHFSTLEFFGIYFRGGIADTLDTARCKF